ncbi:MAG: TonB-dependent receptor plug domain-containing protein [Verrucomicrobia bacterium]|nr:TonB-dependent receptor plug domain-containing protein [Verrucomicrobiota bacterium]MDA1067209.1 TonB-dependent receptor plug domain-containing protein [Verrucomicrobiota bacterium]
MKIKSTTSIGYPRRILFLFGASILLSGFLMPAASAQNDEEEENDIYVLSPFEIDESTDSGYFATNAISGTRVSAAIQDIPLSIEVLTSEFIEDTGSTDLRESLRYSAGILLQSQNDALNADSFSGIGGVNSPEGVTDNKSETSFKVRGFVTDNVLRNGFRRQFATDSVNIDRIEVIRGPSALLYGIGNFGGLVNYVAKKPLLEPFQHYGVTVGSDNLYRVTADVTGPLGNPDNGLAYRVNFAWEDSDDYTDLKNSTHWFASPSFLWTPSSRTSILLDLEFGEAESSGIGFLSVRAPSIEGIPITQTDRLETFGFLEFPGKDIRTFRWSGPDTYLNTESSNILLDLTQEIVENLYFKAGFNTASADFSFRDVFGGISQNSGPESLRKTITARQIIDGSSTDVEAEVENASFQYSWSEIEEDTDRDQARVEMTYSKRIFEDSKWLNSEHSFLAGYMYENAKNDIFGIGTEARGLVTGEPLDPIRDGWNWKDPTDPSPIQFGIQGDGAIDEPMTPSFRSTNDATNEGQYLVYSGRFLNDRLFVVAGLRKDTNSVEAGRTDFRNPSSDFTSSSPELSHDSAQWGVSYEVFNGVTLFALGSEGVQPNFEGRVDGYGIPLNAATAESEEVGLKLSLFDGKLAATTSVFKIERQGVPFSYWWAPAPARGDFDRNADIVYRLDDFNPQIKTDNRYLQAALPEYLAARASGAVWRDENTGLWYINGSEADGAAFLDGVFAALNREFALPIEQRTDLDPWPGWLYNGFDDPLVNTAGMDWSSGDFYQTISDQSSGWEMQIMLSPTDNMQFIFNYSNVEREILNPGNFATYDYTDGNWDRWAEWYFPNTNWGLSTFSNEEVYPGGSGGQPSQDTGTWSGIGYGKGESLDDTPEHAMTFWGTIRMDEDSAMKGWQFALGGAWESEREYASAFTTAGQKKQNESGKKIQAVTDARLTLNGMVKYSTMFNDKNEVFAQLNVDNLLDDTDQYGLLYAPGLSWRLQFGIYF